ncbi:MAG: hypothetical protein Q4D14_03205 [Bacteroidales bacterium]|nr:hypothetical protein [Bacteroidales bacterium]
MSTSQISRFVARFDTNFFERYARLTLIDKLGSEFENLKNFDRPDLQTEDGGLGIEVTRAIDENKSVAKKLINEMAGKHVASLQINDTDALLASENGYAYGLTDDFIAERELDYWNLALPMKRIVSSKVEKVAKGFYGSFTRFGLYIFTLQQMQDIDVEAVMHYMIELQRHSTLHYDILFISQINKLFVCDLSCGKCSSYPITRIESRNYYNKALYQKED